MKKVSIENLILCIVRFPKRLHRDQNGSISVVSVFSFLFLTMVLGMVINMGRHTNRKVKLQNSADAVTYTGTAVVARSMNTLAFTNHLLCDVFALTAYLREARDRNAEALAPSVLEAWSEVAPDFQGAPEAEIARLTLGTPRKVPLEQQMVTVFGQHNAAISEQLLPVMEEILAQEMIPEFQRALVEATPSLANQAAYEIASRHGPTGRGLNPDDEMGALMWRTDGLPFDYPTVHGLAQLPASDPVWDTTEYANEYFNEALQQRRSLSFYYLGRLNNTMLEKFDAYRLDPSDTTFGVAKMSQFGNLWRGFTRGYLTELLDEYPDRNLPYQIRKDPLQETNTNQFIENDYTFVGVAYWTAMDEHMPGLFRNPLDSDSVGFAQSQLYIPQRKIYEDLFPPVYWNSELQQWVEIRFFRGGGPTHWDLLNQNWSHKLVPATHESILEIIQTNPPSLSFETPNMGGITVDQFRRLNSH